MCRTVTSIESSPCVSSTVILLTVSLVSVFGYFDYVLFQLDDSFVENIDCCFKRLNTLLCLLVSVDEPTGVFFETVEHVP